LDETTVRICSSIRSGRIINKRLFAVFNKDQTSKIRSN
jgi:hypothetical protein